MINIFTQLPAPPILSAKLLIRIKNAAAVAVFANLGITLQSVAPVCKVSVVFGTVNLRARGPIFLRIFTINQGSILIR